MISIAAHEDDVNPAARIREIAELATSLDAQERLYRLAAELEIAQGRLTDRMQAALGMTELDLRDLIASVRQEIAARLDTSDERQQTMLQFLETLQEDVRSLQQRPPCRHPEAAREQLEAGG